MENRKHQPCNAEPFVQPVHLVEPAKPRLQKLEPHGQNHADRHRADGKDARTVQHRARAAELCKCDRRKPLRKKPERRQRRQQQGETCLYFFHRHLPWAPSAEALGRGCAAIKLQMGNIAGGRKTRRCRPPPDGLAAQLEKPHQQARRIRRKKSPDGSLNTAHCALDLPCPNINSGLGLARSSV